MSDDDPFDDSSSDSDSDSSWKSYSPITSDDENFSDPDCSSPGGALDTTDDDEVDDDSEPSSTGSFSSQLASTNLQQNHPQQTSKQGEKDCNMNLVTVAMGDSYYVLQ